MNNVVIKVENLSKIYDLGLVGTGTLSKDLNRTWARILGKPDPYATLAELNDRTQKSNTGSVYALKDINFEVQQGEVLGIIGKNGAGKSTLLKILSQITSPSSGNIKIKGRVASLLEVGTGMHPEMTARQNIYLNGAIMGMSRNEITSKLDEIVDFAGIEKYIDTPTKRFSSGMTVRLGFAVAAFLEPEILIVDEVLAVGDAEFQKKAIGKMQDVSKGEGRTVLFVSHNMAAVESLCTQGLVMKNGMVDFVDNSINCIKHYLSIGIQNNTILNEKEWSLNTAPGNVHIKMLRILVAPIADNFVSVTSGHKITVNIWNEKEETTLGFNMQIINEQEICIYTIAKQIANKDSKKGVYSIETSVEDRVLNQGLYKCRVWIGELGTVLCMFDEILTFEVVGKTINGIDSKKLTGVSFPDARFKIQYSESIT